MSSIYKRYSAYGGTLRRKVPEAPVAPPPPTLKPARPAGRGAVSPFAGLDLSDVMLLGLLYLLYRESGDEDFLIILAVVAMSVFRPEKGRG